MNEIKREFYPSKEKEEKLQDAVIHSSVLRKQSPISGEEKSQAKNLSTTVAEQLLHLMTSVVKDEISPSTVNAACNCASQIHKLMRLNLEIKKSEIA